MPLLEKGYRRWDGALRGRFFRWLTIAQMGVRLAFRGKWIRRFLMLAWLPLLYYSLVFFVVGQVTRIEALQQAQRMWQYDVMMLLFGEGIPERLVTDPAALRLPIWALLFHLFMHYTQVFCVMIVVAIVGPKLVSEDLKSRALSLYFVRPLTRRDYVLGKLAVVSFFVAAVTLAPALALYAVSIAFSPRLDTLVQTFVVVPKIFLFSLLLMVVCGLVMLALSSLITQARFLGFAWAGFWVLSAVAAKVLSWTLFPAGRGNGAPAKGDWTGLVSFSANFDAVGFALFDLEGTLRQVGTESGFFRVLRERLSYGHDWWWSLRCSWG